MTASDPNSTEILDVWTFCCKIFALCESCLMPCGICEMGLWNTYMTLHFLDAETLSSIGTTCNSKLIDIWRKIITFVFNLKLLRGPDVCFTCWTGPRSLIFTGKNVLQPALNHSGKTNMISVPESYSNSHVRIKPEISLSHALSCFILVEFFRSTKNHTT